MVRVRGSVRISPPPERILDTVADSRYEPWFNSAMTEVALFTPGPVGLGSRFKCSHWEHWHGHARGVDRVRPAPPAGFVDDEFVGRRMERKNWTGLKLSLEAEAEPGATVAGSSAAAPSSS